MRSKVTIRCMLLILAIMFVVATIPSMAQAIVQHGVALSKGCDVVRVCDTNADCDDGNVCTNDVCDDTFPNLVNCEIQTQYNDQAGDTVRIITLSDTLHCSDAACPVVTVDPNIVAVSGNTTCVVGPFTQCLIGPAGSTLNGLPGVGAPGSVTYGVSGYNPTHVDLPGPIVDDTSLQVLDLCDGGGDTAACVAAPNRTATTQFSTPLVDACEHTPLPSLNDGCPDDGNPCTQSGCNAVGECVGDHVITPSLNDACPDDGNPCTQSGCSAAGVCVFNHVVTPSLDDACPDDGL